MRAFREKHDPSGMNVDRFCLPGQEDAVIQAVGAAPFMAKRRMCAVEGLSESLTKKDDAAMWTKRLAGRGDEAIVVLVDAVTVEQAKKNKLYIALREAEKVHEYVFGLMSERELEVFVRERSRRLGVEWDAAAVRAMVERVGADSWRLAQEVHKVSLAISQGAAVDRSLVETMVAPSYDDALFAFLDAVRNGQGKQAVRLLYQELDRGAAAGQLLMMLEREVQLLCELQAYMAVHGREASAGAARELGVHPFVVKKSMTRAMAISSDHLACMVDAVLSAERRLKGGGADDRAALEQLILDLLEIGEKK